jgi:hypothetical protein
VNFTSPGPFNAAFISGPIAINTGVIGTTATGGAPGTPTYAWSFVGPPTNNPGGAGFVNPPGSSSQRVRFFAPVISNATPQGIRVTATDPLGNAATQDGQAAVAFD